MLLPAPHRFVNCRNRQTLFLCHGGQTQSQFTDRPITQKVARANSPARFKSAETERSISALVNDAVKMSLAEDADDLAVFEARAAEPDLRFEDVIKDLRKRGKS